MYEEYEEIENAILPDKFEGLEKEFLFFLKNNIDWDVSNNTKIWLKNHTLIGGPAPGYEWDEWFIKKDIEYRIEYIKNIKVNITKTKNILYSDDDMDEDEFMSSFALNKFKEYIFNRFSQHDWDTEESYWGRIDLILKLREEEIQKHPQQEVEIKKIEPKYKDSIHKIRRFSEIVNNQYIDQLVQQTNPEIYDFDKNQISELINEHFKSLQKNYPKELSDASLSIQFEAQLENSFVSIKIPVENRIWKFTVKDFFIH